MKYDDEVLIDVSQPERKWDKAYSRTDINWGHRELIADRLYQKHSLAEYSLPQQVLKAIVDEAIEEADKINSHNHGIFGVHDIIDAIGVYLRSDIEKSLSWNQDDFVHALAILDRRCGKRRLEKYASWEFTSFSDWLRRICQI